MPYGDPECAAHNLPVIVRRSCSSACARTRSAYFTVIGGNTEPSADVLAELNRVAGHLRSLGDTCEAAAGRLEWVKRSNP